LVDNGFGVWIRRRWSHKAIFSIWNIGEVLGILVEVARSMGINAFDLEKENKSFVKQ